MSRYAYVPDPENDAVQSVIDELTSPLTRAVLRQLTAHGGLMSGQLALATGAHQQSVLHVLGRLERHGLVRADQPRESRQGRRVRYSADVEKVDRMLATLRRYLLASELTAPSRGPVQVSATA